MTTCQKNAALQYLMSLKQKICRKIKVRGCADGRKQHGYLTKDDTSALTVATEALLLTCLNDAMEHRKVATVDIPGAFMQLDMGGETVKMKLEGNMVYLLTKIDPDLYKKMRNKQKRENDPSRGAGKIPKRHAPGRTSILEKSDVEPTGVGVQNKPIRLVHYKQDS